ncbi:MAG: hypothetical protein GOU99_02615 [Candidatus Altiarchaeota archaeon]|nr:hypothetical protein [Candidatus Altiarchaeota archaeon]
MDTLEFRKWSLKTFGSYLTDSDIVSNLNYKLRKAGIALSGEEYLSMTMAISLFSPLIVCFLAVLVLILLGASLLTTFLVFIVTYVLLAVTIFLIAYLYPSLSISDIQKSISNNLPFATIYMSTLAGAGMTPSKIFKIMSEFKEFGEVSKEAGRITKDIDLLGIDLKTALERAADRTPSKQMRELFWGIKSTITTGGDLKKFLMEKSKSYMADYRRYLDRFVDQLSVLMEVYITAVIVGSIFFIIMGTILGLMGGGIPLNLVRLLIYIGIPMMSIMFMIMIAGMSPE